LKEEAGEKGPGTDPGGVKTDDGARKPGARGIKIYMLGLAKRTLEKGLGRFGYGITKIERGELAMRQAGLNLAGSNKKIHYACGFQMLEGWLNVDAELLFKTQPGFVSETVNLVAPHPFPDNWFEYGFCEDFLEHLTQSDSMIFLSEAYRTFKTGGVLRLSFPGLEGVLKRHYRGQAYGSYKKGKTDAYTSWDHVHFYSREELTLVCRHIGFRDVKFVNYGESSHGPLKGLDHREDQRDLNIYVELTK
jgi:predicted SAM-dependent methyltransferase